MARLTLAVMLFCLGSFVWACDESNPCTPPQYCSSSNNKCTTPGSCEPGNPCPKSETNAQCNNGGTCYTCKDSGNSGVNFWIKGC